MPFGCSLARIAILVVLAVASNTSSRATAFPERSQPGGGGGFRNDTRGGGYSDSNKSFLQAIAEGNRAYDRKDYARSTELYDEAVRLARTTAQMAGALTSRGMSRGMLGQNEIAMQDFDEAIKLNPALSTAYSNRARIFMKMGRHEAAMADVDRAIARSTKNDEAYQYRARLLSREDRWSEALDSVNKAIALYPTDPHYYANRAYIEEHLGKTNAALADASKALSLDRTNGEAYIARAKVHVRLRQYDQAEKDIKTATQLHADAAANDIAWFRATSPIDKLRNGQQAVVMAKRACDVSHWKNAPPIDTLAAAYAETGDFDSAIRYEREAIQMSREVTLESLSEYERRLALYQNHRPYRDEQRP